MEKFLIILFLSKIAESSGLGAGSCDFKRIEIETSDKKCLFSHALSQLVNDFYSTKGPHYHIINAISGGDIDEIFKDLISEMVKETTFPVKVESLNQLQIIEHSKRSSVFIFIDSLKSFVEFNKTFSSENFRFRHYFSVVSLNELNTQEMKSIFKVFWKNLIININLVSLNTNDTIELFTFLPFNEEKCEDTTPVKINNFNGVSWESKVFHPIKTKNLHNCTLIIGCGAGSTEPNIMLRNDSDGKPELYGSEYDIFVEFSKELNFNTRFEVHGNYIGLIFDNGTATGEYLRMLSSNHIINNDIIFLIFFKVL